MLPHCTVHMRIKFSPNEKENHLPNQINSQAAPATHRMSACTYDPARDVPKCCACHEIKSPRVHTTLPMHAPRVHATPDSACTCDPLTMISGRIQFKEHSSFSIHMFIFSFPPLQANPLSPKNYIRYLFDTHFAGDAFISHVFFSESKNPPPFSESKF